jgi:hypothetical protein
MKYYATKLLALQEIFRRATLLTKRAVRGTMHTFANIGGELPLTLADNPLVAFQTR